jgi:lipoate-protein ligase A
MSRLVIIHDAHHDPAFNMAADLYLLSQCSTENTVYLRLYGWDPPAISLGYMQKPEQILDRESLSRDGIDWVVRPTGGRAILHSGDVTYSVAFPRTMTAMGKTIGDSYRFISTCLQRGLALAGIITEAHDSFIDAREARGEIKLPCFLASNRDEIKAGGKKLIGSAQKRTADAVLQHGSIPITSAFRELPDYLRLSDSQKSAQKKMLEEKCACISEVAPSANADQVRECLVRGFAETLGMKEETASWISADLQEIALAAKNVNANMVRQI